MEFFDTLKDTLNKGVAAVSVKSETIVESSRIKSAISNTQKQLDSEYAQLGSKVYRNWKSGTVNMSDFVDDLTRIRGVEQEIESLRARLEQIKEEEAKILGSGAKSTPAGDVIYCTNCGKALPAGSRFCDECGTPVN